MTTRSTQAVTARSRQAAERGNPAVEAAHLAVALLDDTETLARPLLQAVGADPVGVRAEASRRSTPCRRPGRLGAPRRRARAACSRCWAPPSGRPARE